MKITGSIINSLLGSKNFIAQVLVGESEAGDFALETQRGYHNAIGPVGCVSGNGMSR